MSELDDAIRAVAEADDRYGPMQSRTREDLLAAVNVPTSQAWTRFGLEVYAMYWQRRCELTVPTEQES
jgi:hypothetical protein